MRIAILLLCALLGLPLLAQSLEWKWVAADIAANQSGATTVVTDTKGNRYTASVVRSPLIIQGDTVLSKNTSGRSMLLTKYSRQGKLLWYRVWKEAAGYIKKPIVIDRKDNLIIAAKFEDSTTIDSYTLRENGMGSFVAKIDSDANILWLKQLKQETHRSGSGIDAIGCDSSENIYLFAGIADTMSFGGSLIISDTFQIGIIKLSSIGNVLWTNFSCTVENIRTEETGMGIILAVSNTDQLAVTGAAAGKFIFSADTLNLGSNWTKQFVLTYDKHNGDRKYIRQFDHTGYDHARSGDIGYYKEDLFLSGSFTGEITLDSISFDANHELNRSNFFARLNATGNIYWAHQYPETRLGFTFLESLCIQDSFIYATGDLYDSADFHGAGGIIKGVFAVKYDLSGHGLWFASSARSSDLSTASSVCVFADQVTIAGSFVETMQFGDTVVTSKDDGIFLATLTPTTSAVRMLTSSYEVLACYPNPASTLTKITCPTGIFTTLNVVVFTMQGQKVLERNQKCGVELDVSTLPMGSYIVSVASDTASGSAFLQIVR